MEITHAMKMDFSKRGIYPRIEAVQGDSYTRVVEISLYENGVPWDVPDGASALLRFRKPDGTGGLYDKLPDGSTAWSIDDNVVRFTLAPQVLSCPGLVQAQLEIVKGDAAVASFTFHIAVERDPSNGAAASEDYFNWNAWAEMALNQKLEEAKESGEFDGPQGPKGDKPVRGIDYWTDADQEAIEEDSHAYIIDELAKRGQLKPEFANSIEECTDTSKLYVLPDGYFYAYMKKTGALFTNQIANAIDSDGTPFNSGLGYKSGYWIDSNGGEAVDATCIVTGFIPINDIRNLTLRVSGFTDAVTTFDSMKFYNASFENVGIDNTDRLDKQISSYGATFAPEPAYDQKVYTFTYDYLTHKNYSGWYSGVLADGNVKYVRISLKSPDMERTVVTINEEIAFGTTYAWMNTGHAFIPADYEDRIITLEESTENHEDRIITLEMYGSDSVSSEDIPTYIKTEADDVMSRVIASQGNRSFTLVAISDIHYGGTGDNKDNLIRASKAISYIGDRIHIDAIATLGDNLPYGSDYNDTIRATADRWCKEINEILRITQKPGIVDFRTPGNHDRFGNDEAYMPDNAIYSFIGGYNRQCDHVDVPGGWAYHDFGSYKLRIIVLNTAECEGRGRFTENSGYHMSSKQYNWLIDTLDMSDKADAADWQILILSHHRPDDWQAYITETSWGENGYILPNILHAYRTGGNFSGTNPEDNAVISCNFSGRNQATLIGSIHGHHHAYIYDHIYLGPAENSDQTNIMAISTPTSSFGSGEGYNDDNEGNWYSSVKGTAEETAFCVYCIDLDNHKIHAIHYGNGIDREISY